MKSFLLIITFWATATVAQPRQQDQFSFPQKRLDFSLVKTTTAHQQHVDAGDTLHYLNSEAVYLAGKDTLVIYRSRFETAAYAMRMANTMTERLRAGKAGYASFNQDTVLGVPITGAATAGKADFFFRADRDIFWLTGAPKYCYQFLEAFLKKAGLAKK